MPFKQHSMDYISHRPHITNKANKHLVNLNLDADRLFFPKKITAAQITLNYPYISASSSNVLITFANKIAQTHKS